jgi:predicted transport protein
MALADQILTIARESNPKIEFNFNKSYITTSLDGKRSNLLMFVPQKKQMKLTVRLKSEPEIDKICEDAGFEANYSTYWGGYQFDLRPDDFEKQRGFFRDLIKRVYAGGKLQ